MVTGAELGESAGEVYGIAGKEVAMDTIERAINLRDPGSESARACHYGSQHTKNVMFPSLKKYVSCRWKESSIPGYVLVGVRLLGSPVEEFTGLVPVSVASSGTFVGGISDVIDSKETTEAELEDAGDAAGALAPQETMCGAIGITVRIEWGSGRGGPKFKAHLYCKLNTDHVSLPPEAHLRATGTMDGNTKDAEDTSWWTYCVERLAEFCRSETEKFRSRPACGRCSLYYTSKVCILSPKCPNLLVVRPM